MGLATVQGQLISKGALKFKIADSSLNVQKHFWNYF